MLTHMNMRAVTHSHEPLRRANPAGAHGRLVCSVRFTCNGRRMQAGAGCHILCRCRRSGCRLTWSWMSFSCVLMSFVLCIDVFCRECCLSVDVRACQLSLRPCVDGGGGERESAGARRRGRGPSERSQRVHIVFSIDAQPSGHSAVQQERAAAEHTSV